MVVSQKKRKSISVTVKNSVTFSKASFSGVFPWFGWRYTNETSTRAERSSKGFAALSKWLLVLWRMLPIIKMVLMPFDTLNLFFKKNILLR